MQGAGLVLEMVQSERFSASIMKYQAIVVLWGEGKAPHLPELWIGKK